MPVEDINLFLIDMTELPKAGPAQMIIRAQTEDRDMVSIAAQLLGLSQAEFLRCACVATARKVIQEKAPSRN
jgi:uncharacterized protein (DUF1778 family)